MTCCQSASSIRQRRLSASRPVFDAHRRRADHFDLDNAAPAPPRPCTHASRVIASGLTASANDGFDETQIARPERSHHVTRGPTLSGRMSDDRRACSIVSTRRYRGLALLRKSARRVVLPVPGSPPNTNQHALRTNLGAEYSTIRVEQNWRKWLNDGLIR